MSTIEFYNFLIALFKTCKGTTCSPRNILADFYIPYGDNSDYFNVMRKNLVLKLHSSQINYTDCLHTLPIHVQCDSNFSPRRFVG